MSVISQVRLTYRIINNSNLLYLVLLRVDHNSTHLCLCLVWVIPSTYT